MTARYLLDTNALSEPTKERPNFGLVARLKRHAGEVALATPTWHELWCGIYRLPASKKRTTLEAYLRQLSSAGIPMLPYDTQAAEWHAHQRARLSLAGNTPSFIDGQIAAIAVVHDLTLVTANVEDFQPFEGLRVEDWTAA